MTRRGNNDLGAAETDRSTDHLKDPEGSSGENRDSASVQPNGSDCTSIKSHLNSKRARAERANSLLALYRITIRRLALLNLEKVSKRAVAERKRYLYEISSTIKYRYVRRAVFSRLRRVLRRGARDCERSTAAVNVADNTTTLRYSRTLN